MHDIVNSFHRNLPDRVSFGNSNKIEYFYDAVGVKLKKQVTENGTVTKTIDYAGNYIYENDELQFFNHPESYATPVNAADYDSGFYYVYQYKDHLGNIRLSYKDNNGNLEIVEENNYYPFGLEHKGYNNVVNGTENNYKTFQGQELEKELGKNTYAYQWRDYDPAIGRFNKIDRFSEKHVDASSYSFTANNPIAFREIAGDSIKTHFYDKKGKALNTIPKTVQKMFNEEFGIKVGYNSKTNMLYFDGNMDSDLSQSESATEIIVTALEDDNTGKNSDKHGTIIFGYNMDGMRVGSVNGGAWDRTGGLYKNSVTQIDLADFDADGNSTLFNYSSALNPRAFNMARTFEHEYLGHQKLGVGGFGNGGDYTMGRVVRTVNQYARERNIPERLHYGSSVIFFGSTSAYKSRRDQRRAVRKMVNGTTSNNLFVKRKKKKR